MNVAEFSLVPLQKASLCMDCDMITAGHTHCLACGSAALLNLARTLNGETYNDLAPQMAAKVSQGSGARAFEGRPILNTPSRSPHRSSQNIPFPLISGGIGTKRPGARRWSSPLRGVAALMRTMTVAVISILMVGRNANLQGPALAYCRVGPTQSQSRHIAK